jgi:hypothetical protein
MMRDEDMYAYKAHTRGGGREEGRGIGEGGRAIKIYSTL